ncbi:hypothetical protein AR687_18480 [Flavobacteriaceae bacterium CRH]|nr:hypothetical protein AR687_18480 [Flavobacteriaceae bacterium CRH]
MKRTLLLLIILTLGSCTTIFNKKNHTLSITTNAANAKVKVNDSLYQLPAKVIVKHSKKNLPIELISDSLTKKYTLKPSVNYKFLFGNLLFLDFFPVAYITDLTNQKRFSYQQKVFLDINDSINIIKTNTTKKFEALKHHFTKEYPVKKGEINFTVAFSLLTNYHFELGEQPDINKTGFGGLSLGLEYFYNNKNYFAVNFNASSPFDPFEYFENYERINSVGFGITHNYKIKRFSIGYGLNYTRNYWVKHTEYYTDPEDSANQHYYFEETFKRTNKRLGATLNGYYQFTSYLYLGLNYNQSFLNLGSPNDSHFDHVISMDLVFKFSPNKRKL